jgi:hypothetical protein
MIIEKIDPGRPAFSDYSLAGTILTIGGVALDLAAEEEDQEVIITFSNHNGSIRRGMMPRCEYVADVVIPPRKYETVEVDGSGTDTAGSDGNGANGEKSETHTESVPVPLNLDSVTLRLWPVTAQGENKEQGVSNAE